MGSCRQAGVSITTLESTQNIVVLYLRIGAFFPNQSTEGIMRLLTLFFLIYLTQGSRVRRQSLIDRIRAQARGQAKPVECRACSERARETQTWHAVVVRMKTLFATTMLQSLQQDYRLKTFLLDDQN